MIDSEHFNDQQDIAGDFNNYFSSIIDKISKNIVDNRINDDILYTFHYNSEQNYVHPSSLLVFKTFSTKEIKSIIKSLKTKNSHGYNETSKLLTIDATYKCSPLTYICNKSILSGIFPDCLKFCYVTYTQERR